MRVIVMVKASKESEAGVMPTEELLRAMGNFNEQLMKTGIMLAGEGLQPSSKGKRVAFSGAERTVLDGPFAETKELIAGYWIWQVGSIDEAVDWVKRCPNPMLSDSEIEIRPVFEAADFGEEFTPELRAQEEHVRAEVAAQVIAPSEVYQSRVFVNLPVKNLASSVEFFTRVGYTFNQQFTDENATCMVISDIIYAMLLVEPYFKTFTDKPLADAKATIGSSVSLSLGSRQEVDAIIERALTAGAREHGAVQDLGFMYQRGFEDLDGHVWDYLWMDPSFVQG